MNGFSYFCDFFYITYIHCMVSYLVYLRVEKQNTEKQRQVAFKIFYFLDHSCKSQFSFRKDIK